MVVALLVAVEVHGRGGAGTAAVEHPPRSVNVVAGAIAINIAVEILLPRAGLVKGRPTGNLAHLVEDHPV